MPTIKLNNVTALTESGGAVSLDSGLIFPAGHILQTIVSHKTDTTDINGASSTGWFDVGNLSAAITPASSSNKILVVVQMNVGTVHYSQGIMMKVLRNTGSGFGEVDYRGNTQDSRSRVIGGSEEYGGADNDFKYTLYPIPAQFLDSPSTINATTYKVQIRVEHASYAFVNRTGMDGNSAAIPRGASSITLQEIAQ